MKQAFFFFLQMTPPADLVHLTYTVIFAVNIFQVVTLLTLAEVAAEGVHTLSVVRTEVLSSYTFINIWGQTTLKDILLHLNSKDDVQSLCNGRQQVNINKYNFSHWFLMHHPLNEDLFPAERCHTFQCWHWVGVCHIECWLKDCAASRAEPKRAYAAKASPDGSVSHSQPIIAPKNTPPLPQPMWWKTLLKSLQETRGKDDLESRRMKS